MRDFDIDKNGYFNFAKKPDKRKHSPVQRFVMWRLRRKCLKAAYILQACGHENGKSQKHINDAKDAIYEALHHLR